MIAVVTSTIKPANHSFFDHPTRLEQTRQTLDSLYQKAGTIFLIDNSPGISQAELDNMLTDYPHVKKIHLLQYQFDNKGITEVMMLLSICDQLPLNTPIFKISGRYSFIKPVLNINIPADFMGKGYRFNTKYGTVSTRGYWVKNVTVFKALLLETLTHIFTYPEKITGARSFFNKFNKVLFNKDYKKINTSVEFAMAIAIKNNNYSIKLLDDLGIQGYVAGADKLEQITE
ncbi:hypothetical protein [Mucilaginibacter sp.]|jgi:hypothetical protein|uniref:hypothetical protein n=1 Tax=Mucilaginibacter sp. TaxID=1882438 RepID=UPI0035641AA3